MAWESSGVPGAPTRTSWFERDVPSMWRVLENQQSDDHWRLVAGWRKAADLTATHLSRLEQYRANLAEAWPPDRNTAAAAYVSRLDFLIQNVRATHDVAAANYSTLAATVGALALARRDLKPLYDEYVTRSRAMKAHADLATFNAMSEAPTAIGAAPAGPEDLERLNNRARAIMYTLSHTLVEAEAAIRQPPAYQPQGVIERGNPDVYGKNADAATRARAVNGSISAASNMEFPGPRPSQLPSEYGVITPGTPSSNSESSFTRVSATDERRESSSGIHGPSSATARTAKSWRSPAAGGDTSYTVHLAGGLHNNATEIPRRILPPGGLIEAPGYAASTRGTVDRSPIPPTLGVIGGKGPNDETRRSSRYHPTHFDLHQRSDPADPWRIPEGVPTVIQPREYPRRIDPGPLIG